MISLCYGFSFIFEDLSEGRGELGVVFPQFFHNPLPSGLLQMSSRK